MAKRNKKEASEERPYRDKAHRITDYLYQEFQEHFREAGGSLDSFKRFVASYLEVMLSPDTEDLPQEEATRRAAELAEKDIRAILY